MSSKALLTIDNFTGIVTDESEQTSQGFYDCLGLDLTKEKGVLQINKRLKNDSYIGVVDEDIYGFTTFDGKIIAGADNKDIYYNSSSTSWSVLHTNANTGDNQDITTYQKFLIYASRTRLGISNDYTIAGGFSDSFAWASGTTFANGGANDLHFFREFNNRLYISDGNNIAELDGASDPVTPANWIFNNAIFTLPENEIILCMEVFNGELYIGTQNGNIYVWDGASDNSSNIIKTTYGSITAMIVHDNALYVCAGIGGVIYVYNGSDLLPIIRIPRYYSASTTSIHKNGIKKYRNGLIIACPFNGIYIWDRYDANSPYVLYKYGNLSDGNVISSGNGHLHALYMIDTTTYTDNFIISYDEDIDRVDQDNYYTMEESGAGDTTSAPYFETVIYELRDNYGKKNKVQGVQGLFSAGTNNIPRIQVSYRLNGGDGGLDTYTILGIIGTGGVSLDAILRGIGKIVDKVQIKVKFGVTSVSTNYNTRLSKLSIY